MVCLFTVQCTFIVHTDGVMARLSRSGWLIRSEIAYTLEMGRSSADTEVRPKNSAECSARFGSATCDYSAEVRPNFGKHSASFVASHLRRFAPFALAADVN